MVLLTVIDGKYELMLIDAEGIETLQFNNLLEAMFAKRAFEDFINEREVDIRKV